MKRNKKIQELIDTMNERSRAFHFTDTEEGNNWIIWVLIQLEQYKGFMRCFDKDGNEYIKIL